jgi:RND family efflux transporter MFP subunit
MNKVLKIVLPLVILVVGAGVTALMIKHRQVAEPEPFEVVLPLVRVEPLNPTNHQFVVHTQGTVSPRTEINLVSEVSGRILSIAPGFHDGGFFEEGELLVSLDSRDYELNVTRARASLAEARTMLDREQAEAAIAQEEWKRLGRGKASPLLLREPQLAQAGAAVESAEANLQIAQRDLERCEVQAPFAGRIRTKRADVGQFVNRGETLARIYAVDYVEVRLPLALDDLAYVNLPVDYRGEESDVSGPTVKLSARIGGEPVEWQGRIVRTEGEIDVRTRMINAVARVDRPYARDPENPRPPLAVGLFVDAAIEGRRLEGVYVVPRLAFRPGLGLMVVDTESRLQLRPIQMLRLESDYLVFRDGVEPGDRLCVSPLDVVTDGMEVAIIDENPTSATAAASAENPAPIE